ncbi:MAG: N-acetylglucosamine 6-phosphate deacetylase [Acidimicrobiales bacterium]|nr:N-acetylglucosamine 6-phosphate deacetylase [Acidimicrobiales bacterium]
MTETLAAARVVTPAGVLAPGVVEVDGGVITAVGSATGPVPARTLVPGFVDLQVNGIDDVDVAGARGTDWDRLDELLVAQGVTAWCPTLVTNALDSFAAPLAEIAGAAARPPDGRPAIAGAHLEGPFLGAMHGAHPHQHVVPFDDAFLKELPPVVRLVTLGPEQPGAPAVIADLTNRGITVALGHSAASFDEVAAAAGAGASLVTHCFNGMPPLHHREPGMVGAALSDPRLAVSLIADLVHVHPAALTIAFRAKGAARVVLVTDAVAWRSHTVGDIRVRFDGRAPRLADGTLAGSALSMDRALRNVVGHAGIGLADAVRAAATTPADLLGLADRGRIEVGARADVVALDDDLEVAAVRIGGERVR